MFTLEKKEKLYKSISFQGATLAGNKTVKHCTQLDKVRAGEHAGNRERQRKY